MLQRLELKWSAIGVRRLDDWSSGNPWSNTQDLELAPTIGVEGLNNLGPKAQQLKLTSCNNWSWHIDRFQQLGTEPRSEGSRIGAKNLQQLELTVEPMVQQLERSIQELERGSEGSTIEAKKLLQSELAHRAEG